MNNGKLESCDAVNTIEMFILENLAQSETPWPSTLVAAWGKDRGQALTLPKVGILQKTSTQNWFPKGFYLLCQNEWDINLLCSRFTLRWNLLIDIQHSNFPNCPQKVVIITLFESGSRVHVLNSVVLFFTSLKILNNLMQFVFLYEPYEHFHAIDVVQYPCKERFTSWFYVVI